MPSLRFAQRVIVIVIQSVDFVLVEPLITDLHPGAEGRRVAVLRQRSGSPQPLSRNAGNGCGGLFASTGTVAGEL